MKKCFRKLFFQQWNYLSNVNIDITHKSPNNLHQNFSLIKFLVLRTSPAQAKPIFVFSPGYLAISHFAEICAEQIILEMWNIATLSCRWNRTNFQWFREEWKYDVANFGHCQTFPDPLQSYKVWTSLKLWSQIWKCQQILDVNINFGKNLLKKG